MKLICVTTQFHKNHYCPRLEVGTEYTATAQEQFGNESYFMLAEFPSEIIVGIRHNYYYNTRSFATLPSTTEEIAVECEQEAIIYQR